VNEAAEEREPPKEDPIFAVVRRQAPAFARLRAEMNVYGAKKLQELADLAGEASERNTTSKQVLDEAVAAIEDLARVRRVTEYLAFVIDDLAEKAEVDAEARDIATWAEADPDEREVLADGETDASERGDA
jgi:hypothetical protein